MFRIILISIKRRRIHLWRNKYHIIWGMIRISQNRNLNCRMMRMANRNCFLMISLKTGLTLIFLLSKEARTRVVSHLVLLNLLFAVSFFLSTKSRLASNSFDTNLRRDFVSLRTWSLAPRRWWIGTQIILLLVSSRRRGGASGSCWIAIRGWWWGVRLIRWGSTRTTGIVIRVY